MQLKRKKHQPARLATACLGLLAALAVVQEVQGQVFLPAGTTNWTGTKNYAGQDVYVGYNGNTATLNADAATIASGTINVGNKRNGVSGNGTVFMSNGTTWIANYPGLLDVGVQAGDTGAMTVDGTGTRFQIEQTSFIGDAGTGSLSVQNGGSFAGGALSTGNAPTAVGTISVDGTGSQLNTQLQAIVGNYGQGSMAVTGGGSAAIGYYLWVGNGPTGVGSVTIDGTGSQVSLTNNSVVIGSGGTGALSVSGGGTLSIAHTAYGGAYEEITAGKSSGSHGTIEVTGMGSTLIAPASISIGEGGHGSLTITDGGRAVSGGATTLGFWATGSGHVTVDGAGSVLETAGFGNRIGQSGNGEMNVSHGGLVTTGNGGNNWIGDNTTGVGTVNVSDAGSEFHADGANYVGRQGTGTLNLLAGGIATAPTTYVGYQAGSHGTVNIVGAGAALQTTNLYVGGSAVGAGGVGQITVDHGGSILINAGGVAQIWSTGSLDLHDGTLINNGTFNNAGTLTLGPGAVLAGSGVYNGSLTIADGTTLAPGNSPGTMTFNGDQTWGGGGNLDLQLLNTTGTAGVDWDKLLINGVLNLTATPADPFVINLATLSDSSTAGLLAGFDPFSSYQWLFLTASSITGFNPNAFEVNTADFWNVFSNGTFGVHQDGGSLYLDYHAAFVPPPTDGTVTPEPTSLALAGCAGLGMAVGAWRRRLAQKSQAA